MITYVGLMSLTEEEGQFEPSRVAECRKVWRHADRAEVTS
jgi:hypothetical protein